MRDVRPLLLAALLLVTGACGAYRFPGEAPAPSPEAGAVAGRVVAVPCAPIQPAGTTCAGRPVAGLEIDYLGGRCGGCRAVTDSSGTYATELPPGNYSVTLKTYMRVLSGPLHLIITAGSTTTADYVLDSGIRAPAPQQ